MQLRVVLHQRTHYNGKKAASTTRPDVMEKALVHVVQTKDFRSLLQNSETTLYPGSIKVWT